MNKEEYISQLMYFNRETGKPENLYTEKYVNELQNRISKAIELLKKYNDKENNYYVPVDNCIDILKGDDKE